MAHNHPKPSGTIDLPIFRDLPTVMDMDCVADYFDVPKQLAMQWANTSPDWPAPFASPPEGALYVTADVIEWGRRHERQPADKVVGRATT